MKPFKYEPKGLWVSVEDSARRRLHENAPRKLMEELECHKALEMLKATCKAKGYAYKTLPLVPAVYVSKEVGDFLLDIMPPAWKRLDLVVIE